MRNNAGTMINVHKLDMNKFRLKIKAAPTYQEKDVLKLCSNSNSGCTHTKKKATQILRVWVGLFIKKKNKTKREREKKGYKIVSKGLEPLKDRKIWGSACSPSVNYYPN